MTCKALPSVVPYRFTLRGTVAVSSEGDTSKIEISADVKNLTTLLKDEELSGYIRAVCFVHIDDDSNGTIRGTEVIDATDVSSGIVDFDIDLFETMSFNWWDSFTDIWCETYILIDTQLMSEDYNITIPEEYYNMKGEVTTTYVIKEGVIQDLVVDERKTQPSHTDWEVEPCHGETTDVDTPGDFRRAPTIDRTFGSSESEDDLGEGTGEAEDMGYAQ